MGGWDTSVPTEMRAMMLDGVADCSKVDFESDVRAMLAWASRQARQTMVLLRYMLGCNNKAHRTGLHI